jgi:hypothetical protein
VTTYVPFYDALVESLNDPTVGAEWERTGQLHGSCRFGWCAIARSAA